MKYFLVLSRILLLRFRGSHLTLNGSRTAAGLRWPPSSERYCEGSNEGTAASQNHPTLRKDREEWGTRKIQDSIPKRFARESCDIADKAKKGVPSAIYLSPERRAFPAGTPNTSHDAMNGQRSQSSGTGPTDSRITVSTLSKSNWSSSKAGRGKSRSPGAMARSVFKRAVKMGSKEVRKSTLRSFNWPVEGSDLYVSASQTLARLRAAGNRLHSAQASLELG